MMPTPEGREIEEIVIIGGLPGKLENNHASAGDLSWRRGPDESVEAFRDRCRHAAAGAGEPFLVFGGLPLGVADDGL